MAKQEMVTRTFITGTDITFKAVIGGEVQPESHTYHKAGQVGNAIAECKAALKAEGVAMGKFDSVNIIDVHEDKELLGCTVKEFLAVAMPIEA